MIVIVYGTHGSGKSTIVYELMRRYPHWAEGVVEKGRTKGRAQNQVIQTCAGLLCVAGQYPDPLINSGCDTIKPYSAIWGVVEHLLTVGDHVLIEGGIMGDYYGAIGKASETYGDNVVFAPLDTPVEECMRRINLRRAAKGMEPRTDFANIERGHRDVWRTIEKIRTVYKRRVVVLNHRKPVAQLLGLLIRG